MKRIVMEPVKNRSSSSGDHMHRINETRAQHIGHIQDALIIKFIGLDNSEEYPGDARFRQRHLTTIREFYPTKLISSPYGVDGRFFSPNEGERNQAARTVIANQPWEFLIGMRWWECPAAEEIRRYMHTIKDLATEFGLRPKRPDDAWWGYDRLHDAVSLAMKLSRPSEVDFPEKTWWDGKPWGDFVPSRVFTPSSWERDPWTDKKEVKSRLLKEFEEHWNEGDQLLKNAGYSIFPVREMINHIHWLFLAICPDSLENRQLTYQEIADREPAREYGIDTSTATKAVLRLAQLLDIDLGRRRGRRK